MQDRGRGSQPGAPTERALAETTRADALDPRRILVAIDAEGLADHAVQAALELGRRFGSTVDLIHAVRQSALPWRPGEDPRVVVDDDLFASTRKSLTARLEKAYGPSRAIERLEVAPGPPAQVILERARL